jgi:2,3-bisphosphoglycerate-independent phosphoglycerate mutase
MTTDATSATKPRVVLCILDGVGYRSGPGSEVGNAIIQSEPAFYNSLFERYPFTTLEASGLDVGLPEGQMGNSEVGHLTIGAGRIVNQELVRISNSVQSGDFGREKAWTSFIEKAKQGTGRLHLLGLVSPGGVHSHTDHLYGIIATAHDAGIKEIYVHVFLDGRDTDPRSGLGYVKDLANEISRMNAGKIATVCGRYWAMDRDKRWDRVSRAWDMLVKGTGLAATNAMDAIATSYETDTTDEFVEPTVINGQDGQPTAVIGDGDSVFFWNFRADRARELTWAFMKKGFDGFDEVPGFDPGHFPSLNYLTMTPYDQSMDLPFVFQPEAPVNSLPEVLAQEGLKNLRAAETEKYAHVTYFFNGGREEPFPGEERRLVPSPKVATYDLQPSMSAPEVAAIVKEACLAGQHDVIIVNFANGDMVGHTGIIPAAVEAFQTLDRLLAEIMPDSIGQGTVWLVTADHGNCDEMLAPNGAVLTQHSLNKVPLIIAGREFEGRDDAINAGSFGLADISPTILHIIGIKQPAEMTGKSVLRNF